MLLIPRATEKAYSATTNNTYVFNVSNSASKQAIAKAVEETYKVSVTKVKTLVRNGKPKRFSRGKHAYPGTTFTQDKKIAYVTLKEGDKIAVFEENNTEASEEVIKEAKVLKADNVSDNNKKGDK